MTEETLADLLDQGRLVHGIAGPLTIASTVAVPALTVLHKPPAIVLAVLTVAVVLGLIETLLALRVAFDAAALRRMAGHADGMTGEPLRGSTWEVNERCSRPEVSPPRLASRSGC